MSLYKCLYHFRYTTTYNYCCHFHYNALVHGTYTYCFSAKEETVIDFACFPLFSFFEKKYNYIKLKKMNGFVFIFNMNFRSSVGKRQNSRWRLIHGQRYVKLLELFLNMAYRC